MNEKLNSDINAEGSGKMKRQGREKGWRKFVNLNFLCAFMHSLENIPCSMNNLNIRDSLEFLHRNSIKNSVHDFAIKSSCFFLRSLPLTNWSSGLLLFVFNRIPDSLINIFQECFHPYFPVGIVIPIKVRWDHKRVTVFHDNRGQVQLLDQRI